MKISSVVLVAFVMLVAACQTEKPGHDITIKGRVTYPQEGTITITEIRTDSIKPFEDTIQLHFDHTFSKKIRIQEPGFYRISFYKRQYVSIILDKNDLDITADANDPDGFFEVKGSPNQDLVANLQQMVNAAQESEAAKQIGSEFEKASKAGNEVRMQELQMEYQEKIMNVVYDSASRIVAKAPLSLGLIRILQNSGAFDKDRYFPLYLQTAERFRAEWPTNAYAKGFVSYVDRLKKTAIGQPAPEISLPDPSGKLVTLSSYRGKYVLVDFWAKWCGPCRQENPNVVKAWKEFKGDRFDILGVSLDRVREDWVNAIQEDGLGWTQVSDLKYFQSQPVSDYNIEGIPFSVLVDPNGIIVAKNLRGAELRRKLLEVLNKKS
jgi:peroxiredoxin